MQDAAQLLGQVVDTYCDLHRHCTSLRSISGPDRGLVVAKAAQVVIGDVAFRVQAGGLRRVRDSGVREVHAYARGRLTGCDAATVRDSPEAVRVSYNPFKADHFVRADTGQALTGAETLAIDGKAAYAVGPRYL